MTTLVSVIAGWLLTYLVHSTLLLGGVALLTRYVVKRESLRETMWKTALVGAVLTATAALALPRPGALRVDLAALGVASSSPGSASAPPATPGRGDFDLDRDSNADTETVSGTDRPASEGVPTVPGGDRDGVGAVERTEAVGGAGAVGEREIGSAGAPADREIGSAGPAPWVVGGLALWAVVAALLLFRLSYRHVRLRWLLRDRVQVAGTEKVASVLTELRRTAGVWKPVRLTASSSVATPLALGGVEICVPDRFLTELGEEEQRAALAHELAHLARRDPFWQVAGSVLGAVFFFQPLNAVARKAIRSAAEYLADGWAVAHTGSRVELAKCLAVVAGWVAPSTEPALAGTVAMAEGGSPLLRRVQRLLEQEPESATRPALRLALAASLVVVVGGFGPAVVGGEPEVGDLREDVRAALRDAPREASRNALQGVRDVVRGDRGGVQDSLRVRRFDRPGLEGVGFVARLNEAGRDARQAPYTVAYAISSPEGVRRVTVDSRQWQSGEMEGRPLAEVLGVQDALAAAGPDPLLVLVELVPRGASTRVERIALRRPDLAMPIGGTVYWLGAAGPEESFRWLRDIYRAVGDRDLRETVVEAVGLHPLPEAEVFLRRVLDEERDTDTREEAMEGLALRPDTALARLFFELALSDPAEDIRREATEQLGRMRRPFVVPLLERLARESSHPEVQHEVAESLGEVGSPEAAAALGRLIESHPSADVRREALDQLAELEGGLSGEAILAMALSEDDPDLRRDAVEALEELPPEQAVSLLRRAAFESGDGTVERQAAESLGEVGTETALAVLVEILERNSSEHASFQAVEAIAENFPRDMVIPVLRDVLSRHPSSRVRREALDALGDLGG